MFKLTRVKENPILTPTTYYWENMLVFNPGAAVLNNEIYLLYRAIGTGDEISRFGLAKSMDGVHFERQEIPSYAPTIHKYETLGVEDVRIVKIENKYYCVYTAVSREVDDIKQFGWTEGPARANWKIPRIGLATTIDFIHYKDDDIILPHIIGKDASLFPKKFNGRYAILYRDREETTFISFSTHINRWENSYPVFTKREGFWDNKKVGIGAPPIFTEKGWLLFYHGVDSQNIYRLGVMFLDLNDPKKILYRSNNPVFEPETEYEKQGFVPNVVFTCGVIEKNNEYYVYYGAGDTVVGLAKVAKQDVLSLF